jgi:uncharacterized repeat protein (TIGR01451 family)
VTQADINAGSIYNTASATGYFGNTPYTDTDDNTVTVTTGPSGITLTKTSTPTNVTTAGQVITYTLVAQNTGNVTLTNVVVTDPMLPTLSCGPVTLAPGASATCTQTYTVTQADINAGSIYNTASATGYFGNTPYTDTDDNTVTCDHRTIGHHADQNQHPIDRNDSRPGDHLHAGGTEHRQRDPDRTSW